MVADTVIKEYFRLTGRPIATMTVEEYLRFLSVDTTVSVPVIHAAARSNDNRETINDDVSINETAVSHISNSLKATTDTSADFSATSENTAEMPLLNSSDMPDNDFSSFLEEQEPAEASQNGIMDILRSVSG